MTSSSVFSDEMVGRLFVPKERWGWEYVEPAPIQRFPEASPEWREPSPPDTPAIEQERAQALVWMKNPWLVLAAVVSPIFSLVLFESPTNVYAALVLVAASIYFAFGPEIAARRKIDQVRREWAADRNRMVQRHEAALEQWKRSSGAHNRREQRRYADATRWYPLQPQSSPSRIDVFGGTGDGWAGLVATMGSGLLATGRNMLVLDFSEQDVAGGLALLAEDRGLPVRQHDLPADLNALDLFHDLGAEDLSELLAEAANTVRQST